MRLLAIDTETELIIPQGSERVNVRHTMPAFVCASWKDSWGYGGVSSDLKDLDKLLALADALVFHNAAFDLEVLAAAGLDLREWVDAGKVLDTRCMYLNRDPDPPNRAITLDYLANLLLGKQLDKGPVRLSYRVGAPLTAAQIRYAQEDAEATLKIAKALQEIPLGSLRTAYSKYAPYPKQKLIAATPTPGSSHPDRVYSTAAANLAWELAPRGMAVHTENLEKEKANHDFKAKDLERSLLACDLAVVVRRSGARPRPATGHPGLDRRWRRVPGPDYRMARVWKGEPQEIEGTFRLKLGAIREALSDYAEQNGISPQRSAKTKQISTKRDDWKDHYPLMPDGLRTFMDFQRVRKYQTAFLNPLSEARATEVFAGYWIPGAATGRWSCTKVNLQQVPRSMRHLYRPREGKVFVYSDYPSLELYTLAHTLHQMGIVGPLMEMLRAGEDPHTWAAAKLGCSRQETKAMNFGLPGGMGWRRLYAHGKVIGLDWTEEQAQTAREQWLSYFWDVAQYLETFRVNMDYFRPPGMPRDAWHRKLGFEKWPSNFELSREVNKGRNYTVALPDGRVLPDRTYSGAANSFFQGLGATVVTTAFNLCCREMLGVCAVVHDSITLEVEDEGWQYTVESKLLKKAMADALATVCPSVPRIDDRIEVKIGTETWL